MSDAYPEHVEGKQFPSCNLTLHTPNLSFGVSLYIDGLILRTLPPFPKGTGGGENGGWG